MARHYQILGEPMPNGKGGHMEPADGYLLALVAFLFSLSGIMFALNERKRMGARASEEGS